MLHVLFLPSWYPTSLNPVNGIFFAEQAKALYNEGVQIGVIAPIQRSIRTIRKGEIFNYRYQVDFKEEDGIPTFRSLGWGIPKMHKLNLKLLKWQALKLIESYIKKYGRPNIIHVQSALWGGLAALYIYKCLNIPYIITEHSAIYARGLIKSWHQRYLKDIFQNAKMLIAVSSSLARLIEPYTSRKSIEVIPNVVNTMFFTLPLNPRAKKPFIFLTVALLTPKKGIDILIRAFASVFKNNSNVELWIGGDGPLRSQLEYLAKMLDVASQIRFLGLLDREKVKLAMWKANAFVLPSYFETFGVVLIEAMSTGLPIISTKCGGPEDFITPKVGYLVSPGDIEGLANTMLTLYDNYSSFNSVEISEFVKDKFSYKSVASQLINIYKKVLLESTMNNLENKKSHE